MAEDRFDPAALTKAAEDTLTVRRVFGEAYEKDGLLVIPVAKVMGMTGLGAGGGEGSGNPAWARRRHDEPTPADEAEMGHGEGHGGGGGYGVRIKPLGVYVVDATGARWNPAVDVTRIVLGGQLVGAWALTIGLAAWAVTRRR